MVYHSLFDIIAKEDPLLIRVSEHQEYDGTLDHVLSETEAILLSSSREESEATRLALHPPRIIRAFVDYKIQEPDAIDIEVLLREAIRLGLEIYRRDDETARHHLKELRRSVNKTKNKGILTRKLKQPTDPVTWAATSPLRSKKTAEDLVARINGKDVLFVALAHGGVAAGMDTYLRFCDEAGSDNSEFYVVRFSTQKMRDETPRLSQDEMRYLQEQENGRQVVLFDEDRASGATLSQAHVFFGSRVFPHSRIIVVTNLNARKELAKMGHSGLLEGLKKGNLSDSILHKKITESYIDKIIKNNSLYDIHKPNEYTFSNLEGLYSGEDIIKPKKEKIRCLIEPESIKLY